MRCFLPCFISDKIHHVSSPCTDKIVKVTMLTFIPFLILWLHLFHYNKYKNPRYTLLYCLCKLSSMYWAQQMVGNYRFFTCSSHGNCIHNAGLALSGQYLLCSSCFMLMPGTDRDPHPPGQSAVPYQWSKPHTLRSTVIDYIWYSCYFLKIMLKYRCYQSMVCLLNDTPPKRSVIDSSAALIFCL